MVYAYDQAIQLPVKDLYDNQVMAMSIAAAKDMYEKGQQEIKDFKKEYGDFMSPIASDMAWYDQNVTGKVRDTINFLYANGIDPLRSAEGRAAVSRVINSINTGEIAIKKQAAKDAEQYKRNRDEAIRNGTYNEAVERAVLGGQTLEEWDNTLGTWKATSPVRFETQGDIIAPLAKSLNPEFDALRTAAENNGYDYKTVSEDRIRKMVYDNIDDLIGNGAIGKYYYDQALAAAGNDPALARNILAEQYTQAAKRHTKEDRELNQYTYQRVQAQERRQAAREQAALNYHYDQLKNWDFDGDGRLDSGEMGAKRRYKEAQIEHYNNIGKGRQSTDGYPNIFDSADRKPGKMVPYYPNTGYVNKIDPAASEKIISSEDNSYYTIPAEHVKSLVSSGEILSQDGQRFNSDTFSTVGELTAIPANGVVRIDDIYSNGKRPTKNVAKQYQKLGKRLHQYYMYAILYKTVPVYNAKGEQQMDENDNPVTTQVPVSGDKNGSGMVLIRATERDANYGKQQAKDKSVDTTN